eukprot:scaffold33332_cov31-Tisochrysis_lutea.AAC.2
MASLHFTPSDETLLDSNRMDSLPFKTASYVAIVAAWTEGAVADADRWSSRLVAWTRCRLARGIGQLCCSHAHSPYLLPPTCHVALCSPRVLLATWGRSGCAASLRGRPSAFGR